MVPRGLAPSIPGPRFYPSMPLLHSFTLQSRRDRGRDHGEQGPTDSHDQPQQWVCTNPREPRALSEGLESARESSWGLRWQLTLSASGRHTQVPGKRGWMGVCVQRPHSRLSKFQRSRQSQIKFEYGNYFLAHFFFKMIAFQILDITEYTRNEMRGCMR